MKLFWVFGNIYHRNYRIVSILLSVLLLFSVSGVSTAQTTKCYLESYSTGVPNCISQVDTSIPNSLAPSLPGVSFKQSPAISPSSAFTYYGATTRPAKSQSELDPRVKDLARALRYDIDNIYEHVHNSVDFNPSFGLKKGARGAILDEDGTALDQAHLMVDLLREADFVENRGYNAKYKIGIVEFTGANGTLADALTWIGVSHAKQLCKTLAANGMPVRVNDTTNCDALGSTVTKLEILHAWVEATVDGQVRVFDPSFKKYTEIEPIDISVVTGYSRTNLLAEARIGSTESTLSGNIPYLRKLNTSKIGAELGLYAVNFANYVQDNLKDKHIDDVLGARRVELIHWPQLRQSSLPYQKTIKDTWSGEVPNKYRTKLTFSILPTNSTSVTSGAILQGYADDLYAHEIKIYSAAYVDNQASTYITFNENVVAERAWAPSFDPFGRHIVNLHVYIDHPYSSGGGLYGDVVSIRAMSENQYNYVVFSMGRVPPNKFRTGRHLKSQNSTLKASGSVVGDQFAVAASRTAKLMSNINNVSITHHHTFGFVTTPGSGISGDNSVHAHDVDTSYSLNSKVVDLPTETASKEVLASLLSSFEGLNASSQKYIAPSGIFLMGNAMSITSETSLKPGFSTDVVRILEVNSGNYAAARNLINANISLMKLENGGASYPVSTDHNYATVDKIGDFVNAGYTAYVPERPLVYGEFGIEHTGNPDGPASGACFYMLGSYSCAFPLNFLAIAPDGNTYSNMMGTKKGADASIAQVGDVGQYITDSVPSSIFASKQVSLSTGELSFVQTLLKTGNGNFPESLSYSVAFNLNSPRSAKRSYDLNEGGGNGSFIMKYNRATDLAISFGERGAIDAAYAVAGIYAATDILKSSSGLEEHMIAQRIAGWMGSSAFNGVSTFQFGQNFNAIFARSPIGSNPAPGSHLELDVLPGRRYKITDLSGMEYIFTDDPVNDNNPYKVEINYPTGQWSKIEWSLTDDPDEDRVGIYVKQYTATNSFGRSVQAKAVSGRGGSIAGVDVIDDTGQTAKLQMISGPWTQFTDPDGNKSRFRNMATFVNAKGEVVMQVEYDNDNRVKSVTDALGNTENYYIANGWRGEVVNAEGMSSINKYNDRGQLIEEVGAERE